ncbi:MAG: four helix bundle protein [Marinilabiliaceae bacterium]|jgi:four helix bundle protein|nr:four helix bundle protein [Marinilabiliaceae bacterium]
MKVSRFEDLEIWQIARELYKYAYELTSRSIFDNDRKLRSQMRGSSGSMADNVAEGFGRGGNKEFYNFLSIAKGSSDELRSQGYRASDVFLISKDEFNYLMEKTEQFSAKTTRLMIYLKSSGNKGVKFD